jgi:hypothetical protein
MRFANWIVLANVVLSFGAGCSSSDAERCDTVGCGNDVKGTGGLPPGAGGQGQGGLVLPSTGGVPSGSGGIEGETCGNAVQPETLPVDIYVMFDQSDSMRGALPAPGTGTWWQASQQALTTFVNSPQAAGVGVGLQYFPLGGVEPASCNANYSTPEVEIADLPNNAGALAASIQAHAPTTFTPTGPALAGAITHMKQWAPNRPGRAPIVVLVTDGFATECEPHDAADIAALAKDAFETEPKVRTFVVGFNLGSGKSNLNQIAKAGGTDQAFFIDQGDIGAQFVAAMLSITAAPLQCSFDIPKAPEGQRLDLKKVFLQFTPKLAPAIPEPLPFMNQRGDCVLNGGKGFFYDNPQTPKQIVLCPTSCEKLAQGSLEIKLGCPPPTGVPM